MPLPKAKKPTVVLMHKFHWPTIQTRLAPFVQIKLVSTRAQLERQIKTAAGILIPGNVRVDSKLLDRGPNLRVVSNYAVGTDNIDIKACAERGIFVTNTPDVLSHATAELALTLLLAVARRLPEGESLCRKGKFKGVAPDLLLGLDLPGRTAMIAGLGRIGSVTARLFEACGMQVEAITRTEFEEDGARLKEKLSRAQVLSLHMPLKPQTRHWLNKKRIALLPSDAIVINTARGPVIDEKALIAALQARKIWGAGLDVYEREPEIPRALRALPNVVLTPHVGSATQGTRRAMTELAVQGILSVLGGQEPPNSVRH